MYNIIQSSALLIQEFQRLALRIKSWVFSVRVKSWGSVNYEALSVSERTHCCWIIPLWNSVGVRRHRGQLLVLASKYLGPSLVSPSERTLEAWTVNPRVWAQSVPQGPVSSNKTLSDVTGAETFCFETLFVQQAALSRAYSAQFATVTIQETVKRIRLFNSTFIWAEMTLNEFHSLLLWSKQIPTWIF